MENNKKQVEVVINGRIYKLGTTDSEEYIKSVAAYVDRKYTEIVKNTDSLTRLSEYFPIMLALNIVDDLFKQADNTGKDVKALSDLKNKIFELTTALEKEKKNAAALEKELDSAKNDVQALTAANEELNNSLSAAQAASAEDIDEINSLKMEIKQLNDTIADFGIKPVKADKNGKIKDKDKDRETILKELNDIKSENGRTKKENKNLTEKIKQMEEELAAIKNTSAPEQAKTKKK